MLQSTTKTNTNLAHLLGPIFGLVYLELCCNFSSSLICHWEGGWIVEEQSSLVFLPHQPSGSESCWGPLRNLFPQETCLDNSPTDGPSARSLIAKRNHLQLDWVPMIKSSPWSRKVENKWLPNSHYMPPKSSLVGIRLSLTGRKLVTKLSPSGPKLIISGCQSCYSFQEVDIHFLHVVQLKREMCAVC